MNLAPPTDWRRQSEHGKGEEAAAAAAAAANIDITPTDRMLAILSINRQPVVGLLIVLAVGSAHIL